MMAHPIRATVEGDSVTMPRAEFDRLLGLLEEAEDVAIFDAVQRRLLNGDDEVVPSAVADRLLAGEDPIRVWRDYRGLTAAELAADAGLPLADLTGIEAGTKEASIATLKALARVLHVNLDDLA